MSEVRVNVFKSVRAPDPVFARDVPLPKLAEWLRTRPARFNEAKEKTALVTFNEYAEPGAGRGLGNIAKCHAIVGDLDHGFDRGAFDRGMDELREAGASVVAYQTWSSKPDAERWRVFVFLDEPIPPSAYLECWRGLNEVFGGMLDDNAKDASRISYLPSHPTGETREFRVIEGAGWEA